MNRSRSIVISMLGSCIVIAGLIGTAFIRWYYRWEERSMHSANAATRPPDSQQIGDLP